MHGSFEELKPYDDILYAEDGYYWSSSLYSELPRNAYFLSVYSDIGLNYESREYGLPIRAVYGDPQSGGNEDITPGGEINM